MNDNFAWRRGIGHLRVDAHDWLRANQHANLRHYEPLNRLSVARPPATYPQLPNAAWSRTEKAIYKPLHPKTTTSSSWNCCFVPDMSASSVRHLHLSDMSSLSAFVPLTTVVPSIRTSGHKTLTNLSSIRTCIVPLRSTRPRMSTSDAPSPPEQPSPEDQARLDRMRSRLEGLFGLEDEKKTGRDDGVFDGEALRNVIQERWGVQYDVQPQKRGDRVYVQVCCVRNTHRHCFMLSCFVLLD